MSGLASESGRAVTIRTGVIGRWYSVRDVLGIGWFGRILMRRRSIVIAGASVALAAATVVSAACSGGGESNGATRSAGGSSTAGSGELSAVRENFRQATFKGTYTLTGSGNPDAALSNGTMVIYKDGPDQFRFDVTAPQNGQDSKISFIQKGDSSAFCLDNAAEFGAILGIDSDKGICFKGDPGSATNPLGGLSDTFSDVAADGDILERSSRTIAGHDGQCYKVKANDTGTVSTSCFSGSGAILYAKTEGADESEIEATEISSSVSGSDFDLPYEERDFPTDLGGG